MDLGPGIGQRENQLGFNGSTWPAHRRRFPLHPRRHRIKAVAVLVGNAPTPGTIMPCSDRPQSAPSPQRVRKSPTKRRRTPKLPTPASRGIPTFSADPAGYPDRPQGLPGKPGVQTDSSATKQPAALAPVPAASHRCRRSLRTRDHVPIPRHRGLPAGLAQRSGVDQGQTWAPPHRAGGPSAR